MPTDLHEQLAAELGLSPDDTEHALNDLLHDVQARVQSGEAVSLPGLGVFSDVEGTLHFTPDPHLQKAVNYRNDHLAPLTIGASSTGPSMPDKPEATPETPSSIEGPPQPVEDDTFTPIEPPPSDEPSLEGPASTPDDEVVIDEGLPDAPEEVAALSDDWAKTLDEDRLPQKQRPPARRKSSSTASTAQVAGLAGSIVLLALLVWFMVDTQGLLTGPGGLFTGTEEPSAGADTAIATAPADDAAPEDTAETEPPAAQATTPATIDRATGGWTIIVASRTRPGEATQVLETYQQRFTGEDMPIDILTDASGDAVRYRIAVGQYASHEAALSALDQVQDRLPEDAWLLRVQPNS